MRLLVIEDDDAIRSVLARGLVAEGFEVDTCADGTSGFDRALDGGYAAVILDLLLPGLNGYAVCERLRAEGCTTPILVLTAKAGELDQIDLLDAGADDFVTKPVSIAVRAAPTTRPAATSSRTRSRCRTASSHTSSCPSLSRLRTRNGWRGSSDQSPVRRTDSDAAPLRALARPLLPAPPRRRRSAPSASHGLSR